MCQAYGLHHASTLFVMQARNSPKLKKPKIIETEAMTRHPFHLSRQLGTHWWIPSKLLRIRNGFIGQAPLAPNYLYFNWTERRQTKWWLLRRAVEGTLVLWKIFKVVRCLRHEMFNMNLRHIHEQEVQIRNLLLQEVYHPPPPQSSTATSFLLTFEKY